MRKFFQSIEKLRAKWLQSTEKFRAKWQQFIEKPWAKWFWSVFSLFGGILVFYFLIMLIRNQPAIQKGFEQARAWQTPMPESIQTDEGQLDVYLYAPQTVGHYSTDKIIVRVENISDHALAGVRVNINDKSQGIL